MVEILSTKIEKIIYKGNLKIPKPNKSKWYVYILLCKDNSLYTGVTNDLTNRMKVHKSGKGSKYVKAKGFDKLLKFQECKNKSDAQKAEYQIKHLPKLEKLNWFIQNKKT